MSAGGVRSFDEFVTDLVEICSHLPVPILIALDPQCTQTRSNQAFVDAVGAPDFTKTELRSHGERIALEELPSRVAARTGSDVHDFQIEFDRDGAEVILSSAAWPLHDDTGALRGAIAVYIDIGARVHALRGERAAREELRAAETRYRLIAEAMPQFVWVDAPDGSAVYANRRWLDYIGLSAEQNAGFGWTGVVHPEDAARLDPERARTLATGENFEGECRYRGRDGKYRWFLFRSIAVRDADGHITSWVGTATDIDRQKRAERQQQFFADASERLGSTLDEPTALARIAQLCVPGLADWCTIDLIEPQTNLLRTAVAEHSDPEKRDRLARFLRAGYLPADADFGAPLVARTGEAQIYPVVDAEMMQTVLADPADRAVAAELGYSSAMVVPLAAGAAVYGTLTLVSADPAHLYTQFDLTTAIELGRRAAIAIEHSRLFQREHHVATTLQRALLPAQLPHVPGYRFHSAYAAAVEQVGGDWYDAFVLDDGRIAVTMGDVAGHGLEAAVTMGLVRQALRTAALELADPPHVLERASAALMLERQDAMVTAVFAVLDPPARTLTYAVAGHPRPRICDARGSVGVLEGYGPPLGSLFEKGRVQTGSATIEPGSSVVFYTDGLVEYSHDIGEGEARLAEVLRSRVHAVAANPAEAVIAGVLEHPQGDDVAVLVLSLAPNADRIEAVFPATPAAAPATRALLRRFAHAQNFDPDREFALLCAAGEAVANAVEHPYPNEAPANVFTLRAAMDGADAVIEVIDRGTWSKSVSVDRGRGITMMKRLVKACIIETTPAGTHVLLRL